MAKIRQDPTPPTEPDPLEVDRLKIVFLGCIRTVEEASVGAFRHPDVAGTGRVLSDLLRSMIDSAARQRQLEADR